MIICNSRKFIFVHIHKTGGTSIERAIDPHLAWNDLILGGSRFGEKIQAPYSKKFGLNKHSSVAEIEGVCGHGYVARYFTFALVRHPVDRLCSLYNWIATKRQGNPIAPPDRQKSRRRESVLKWASVQVAQPNGGFSEFIRSERLSTAQGFRSQKSRLVGSDGALEVKFYRLEEIASWEDDLKRRLGLELVLSRKNESACKLVDPCSISDADRKFVELRFSEDYETFGYPLTQGAGRKCQAAAPASSGP